MLEKTEGAKKKLEILGTQDTKWRETKQNKTHNMCWTPLYAKKHK
jgi:hypothetical protein